MSNYCELCGTIAKYRGRFSKYKYLCNDCSRTISSEKQKLVQVGYRLTRKLREKLGNNCQRCGKPCGKNQLDGHHIVPLSNGGKNEEENILLLCEDCHREEHYR